MNHELYVGNVMHERVRPRRHRFSYRVFWVLADIDHLDSWPSRLFSHNRFNLFSLSDRTHGARDGSSLRSWIDGQIAEAGLDLGGGRVRLLCFPRILGFVFDPLSIWFCDDRQGNLAAVVYEVRNTFGEAHTYVLPVTASEGSSIDHTWDKQFYVSPFIDADATYRFRIRPPDTSIALTVREDDQDGHLFSAVMRGERWVLSTTALLRLFVTHPLMTLKVIAGIHYEAAHLWRKGAPYRSRPRATEEKAPNAEARA